MTTTASPPIRRAIVLAAGLGQRMRPITDTLPKPLVKIGGKAMLDHALDRLADAGVEEAVVNVHHLAGQVETHLAVALRDLRFDPFGLAGHFDRPVMRQTMRFDRDTHDQRRSRLTAPRPS